MDPKLTARRIQQLTSAIATEAAANRLSHPVVKYDFDSDELIVYFNSDVAELPGVSCPVVKDLWLRLDRETERPIGFQFEHFLSEVALARPSLMSFLDIADLRGITVEEIAHLRRQAAQDRPEEIINKALEGFPLLLSA